MSSFVATNFYSFLSERFQSFAKFEKVGAIHILNQEYSVLSAARGRSTDHPRSPARVTELSMIRWLRSPRGSGRPPKVAKMIRHVFVDKQNTFLFENLVFAKKSKI